MIKSCYESLNVYGTKTNEGLEAITMLMQMVLGKYNYNVVRNAFAIWIQNSPNMPKPADIINIIHPPKPKREFCSVTFMDIKRRMRENQFITDEEKKYCDDFIASKIDSPEGQRELIESVIKQVQIEDKRYYLDDLRF